MYCVQHTTDCCSRNHAQKWRELPRKIAENRKCARSTGNFNPRGFTDVKWDTVYIFFFFFNTSEIIKYVIWTRKSKKKTEKSLLFIYIYSYISVPIRIRFSWNVVPFFRYLKKIHAPPFSTVENEFSRHVYPSLNKRNLIIHNILLQSLNTGAVQ